MSQNFEPVVLDFNEAGFTFKIDSLNAGIVAYLNSAIEDIGDLELKMTDAQLQSFFRDGNTNPDEVLLKHFAKLPKLERERLISEYQAHLDDILKNVTNAANYQTEIHFVQFKSGKAELAPQAVEKIKTDFRQTLDTERALKIFNLYEDVFLKTSELLGVMREKNSFVTITQLYEMDRNWNLQKRNFDFNKL